MVFSFGVVIAWPCFSASAVTWRGRAKSQYRQSTRRWSEKTSPILRCLPPPSVSQTGDILCGGDGRVRAFPSFSLALRQRLATPGGVAACGGDRATYHAG